MIKRIKGFPLLLAAALLMVQISTLVFAEEPEQASGSPVGTPAVEIYESDSSLFFQDTFIPNSDALPENGELIAGYIQKKFDEAIYDGISTFGRQAGDYLAAGSLEGLAYNELKPALEKIASGDTGSTVISLSETLLTDLRWSAEELGCVLLQGGSVTAEAKSAVWAKLNEALDFDRLLSALLADCPYELYWYDKTAGVNVGYGISANNGEAWLTSLALAFVPSPDYAGSGGYTVDVLKTQTVSSAVANAQSVVSANASKSDSEKLEAYRAYICGQVSYDHAAANDEDRAYGDPWQLVYVFDEDPDTNVVCEGYSKAFQYLCDLSAFSGEVVCYSVTGMMTGGTGAGGHMWNVVAIDGTNYLADITNCDTGTIGADTKLFLKTAPGTNNNRTYTFPIGATNVVYTYDESQKDLFCEGYLALGSTDSWLWGDVNGDGIVNFNDLQRLYQHLNGSAPLSGTALEIANTNGDDSLNFSDLQRLFTHLNGTNPHENKEE